MGNGRCQLSHGRYPADMSQFGLRFAQTLLTHTKCLLCLLAVGDVADDAGKEMTAHPDVLGKGDFDRELSTALVQAREFDCSPIDMSLLCGDVSLYRAEMN